MKIFILSPNIDFLLSEELKENLESGNEVFYFTDPKPLAEVNELFEGDEERVLAIDPDFCDWKVSNEVIERIPNLKAISLQTTSYSWVDVDFARDKGIAVTNLRGYSTEAVAEWAFLMALNTARRIPLAVKDDWKHDYEKHKGIELRNRKAGIIGLGNIGNRIAELCMGFGMEVVYWSKRSTDNRFSKVSLEELMKDSDLIFPTFAQNEETDELITEKLIRSMKSSAIFVSVIHELKHDKLIKEMVKNGELFGYANEESDHSILDEGGNIWTGLQLAWCTEESFERNAEQWINNTILSTKDKFPNGVN